MLKSLRCCHEFCAYVYGCGNDRLKNRLGLWRVTPYIILHHPHCARSSRELYHHHWWNASTRLYSSPEPLKKSPCNTEQSPLLVCPVTMLHSGLSMRNTRSSGSQLGAHACYMFTKDSPELYKRSLGVIELMSCILKKSCKGYEKKTAQLSLHDECSLRQQLWPPTAAHTAHAEAHHPPCPAWTNPTEPFSTYEPTNHRFLIY